MLLLPSHGELKNYNDPCKKFQKIIYSPNNYLRRFIFENFTLQNLMKSNNIDFIFTFFGPGLPHSKRIKSFVGVAYPIICYPESQYWHYISGFKKLKQKLLNYFRIKRLRQASYIYVETEIMKLRIVKTVNLPLDRICIIPPAVTKYISDREF